MKKIIVNTDGRMYLHLEGIFDKKRKIKWIQVIPMGISINLLKSLLPIKVQFL